MPTSIARGDSRDGDELARYTLTLRIDFDAGDDPAAARSVVTQNMDILLRLVDDLRACVPMAVSVPPPVKLKLQRLNDDALPRAVVVKTL